MHEVFDEAPDGSKLKASFTQYKDYFKAQLQIQSKVGPFFETAFADSIEETTQKLLNQMNHRLFKWKEKRFSKMTKSEKALAR
jgi:transcription termination factor NusB